MTAKAIVELEPGAVREQLLDGLRRAGVDELEPGRDAEEALLCFRAAGSDRPALGRAVEVHVWTGGRSTREVNPFARGRVHHFLGAELEPSAIAALVEHVSGRGGLGVERLAGTGAKHEQRAATRSEDKAGLLGALSDFLVAAGALPHVKDGMLLLLDELFTNAIYNAPVDNGVHLNAKRPRSEPATSPRAVTVRWAADAERAVLAVRDEYGSLTPEVVLSALQRTHTPGQAAPQDKKGGAGLGFYYLLQSSNRLIINIEPDAFTEIIVVRRLTERRRDFMNNAPSFSLCAKERSGGKGARQWERWRVRWPASYGAAERACSGTVLDISPGGCFIHPAQEAARPPAGEEIEITLASEAGELPTIVRGLVTWCGFSHSHACEGFGVQFGKRGAT
jgi:hypothetical protein